MAIIIYSKTYWTPAINETLTAAKEPNNGQDRNCWPSTKDYIKNSFIDRTGTITVVVTGARVRSNLPQGGLDVPCKLLFSGNCRLVRKLERRLNHTDE